MKYLLSILCLVWPSLAIASSQEIIVWKRNYERPYFKAMLNSALTKSGLQDFTLVPSISLEQGEAFEALAKGSIHVAIAATNIQREQLHHPIYVPIDRGLLGFRVCLVSKSASGLAQISDNRDINPIEISIGLGSNWPDRDVFEQNQFKVVTSPQYQDLFDMLQEQKFECFSRSINEVDEELATLKNQNIVLDRNLVFIYPSANFIFVSKKHPELNKQLQIGLGNAIEDRSFYDLFDNEYENALIKNGLYERRMIFLTNTNLSPRALDAINRFGIASFISTPAQ